MREKKIPSKNVTLIFFSFREDVNCVDGDITKENQYSIQKNRQKIGGKSINECGVWPTY